MKNLIEYLEKSVYDESLLDDIDDQLNNSFKEIDDKVIAMKWIKKHKLHPNWIFDMWSYCSELGMDIEEFVNNEWDPKEPENALCFAKCLMEVLNDHFEFYWVVDAMDYEDAFDELMDNKLIKLGKVKSSMSNSEKDLLLGLGFSGLSKFKDWVLLYDEKLNDSLYLVGVTKDMDSLTQKFVKILIKNLQTDKIVSESFKNKIPKRPIVL